MEPANQQDQENTAAAGGSSGSFFGSLFRYGLFMLIVLGLVRTFLLPYQVDGRSMDPNLENAERIFVNRFAYQSIDWGNLRTIVPGGEPAAVFEAEVPDRGDIVVLQPPVADATDPYIKRVIALPGETVSFQDGDVYIDGVKLDEPYIEDGITECSGFCHQGTVPEGYVFVLGDNRGHSSDSRSFGPVPLENIIGKAWFANWPLGRLGFLGEDVANP